MRSLVILLGGVLALSACSSNPPAAPVVDVNNPLMAPGYVAQAASSDQFEIQSGQLALSASRNPAVRQFATMIISDHTHSTQMIMAALVAAHMPPPPPGMMPAQQALLDQLHRAGTGYAFDQAFQLVQIQAHQNALVLHQNYASSGDFPPLRAVAAQIVPVVQRHLALAQSLQVAPPPPPPPPPQPPTPPPPVRRSGERG